MKKLNVLISVLATALIFGLTSCGSSEAKKDNNEEKEVKKMTDAVKDNKKEDVETTAKVSNVDNAKITGKWKVVKAEGKAASENKDKIYEFKADGSANLIGVEYKAYNLGGTNLTMDLNGMEEMYTKWTVSFESDKKISMKTDGLTAWLEKQ